MSAPFLSSTPIPSALRGFARAHRAYVALSEEPLFVQARHRAKNRRVALVSGGGSGHEPMHAGFVGQGMLDAAVPGEIFASPHNAQIFAAAHAVAGPDGVLFIVKNYTGDVINFAIAAERLHAAGIPSRTVLVDDDIASDNEDTETGRRGTGATVIVEKILGAAADSGLGLDELADLGQEVADRSRSLAVAARAQTDFHTGKPAFELAEGTLEFGVGIHGERAAASVTRPDFEELVTTMANQILSAVPASQGTDDALLVFVNGLGANTQIELFNVFDRFAEVVAATGETVAETLVGNYVTALDMSGFSVTVTRLKPEWVQWWNAASATPSFPAVAPSGPGGDAGRVGRVNGGDIEVEARELAEPVTAPVGNASTADVDGSAVVAVSADGSAAINRATAIILRFAELVEEEHAELTRLDQIAGDGDFGDNLRGGLRRTRTLIDESGMNGLQAAEAAFLNGVGGSSGPLLGLLFQELTLAHANGVNDGVTSTDTTDATHEVWAKATSAGCAAIQRVGGAQPGDRTVVDVLAPTAEALAQGFAHAATAAREAAQATAEMQARRGRASYVEGRGAGAPDAGAVGISLLFTAAAEVYER